MYIYMYLYIYTSIYLYICCERSSCHVISCIPFASVRTDRYISPPTAVGGSGHKCVKDKTGRACGRVDRVSQYKRVNSHW